MREIVAPEMQGLFTFLLMLCKEPMHPQRAHASPKSPCIPKAKNPNAIHRPCICNERRKVYLQQNAAWSQSSSMTTVKT